MKLKTQGWALMLMASALVLLLLRIPQPEAAAAGAGSLRAAGRLHQNYAPFGPRTGIVAFLLSPRGLQITRASNHPMARALLRRLGEEPKDVVSALRSPQTDSLPRSQVSPVSVGCGTATGTRFNREPRTPPDAVPQNSPAIDFLLGP